MALRFLSPLFSQGRQATTRTLGSTRQSVFQSTSRVRPLHHKPQFSNITPPSPQISKFYRTGKSTLPSFGFYALVLIVGLAHSANEYRISTEGTNRKWYDLDIEQKVRKRNLIYAGSRALQYDEWEKWIVRFTYTKAGAKGNTAGTGFFINIPDVDKDVILTAGHNLISADAKGNPVPVSNLKLRIRKSNVPVKPGKDSSPDDYITYEVEPHEIFISEQYKANPAEVNAVFDYGAIVLDKKKLKDLNRGPSGGFGFSIDTAYMDLEKHGVTVYTAGYEKGAQNFSYNNGKVSEFKMNQLFYKAKTEQGKSGGPVIMSHRDKDTIVGIHNYGDEGRRTDSLGNRGTRLSLEVLYDICFWTGAGRVARALQVENIEGPTLGLFLKLEDTENGILAPTVKLGQEGFKTMFDILPAYAPPGDFDSTKPNPKVEYVMVHWVNNEHPYFLQLLNPTPEIPMHVIATDVLTERALLKFVNFKGKYDPAQNDRKIGDVKFKNPKTLEERLSNPFAIQTVDNKDKPKDAYYLQVGGEEMTDEDADDEEGNETGQMGLVKSLGDLKHVYFRFVEAKP